VLLFHSPSKSNKIVTGCIVSRWFPLSPCLQIQIISTPGGVCYKSKPHIFQSKSLTLITQRFKKREKGFCCTQLLPWFSTHTFFVSNFIAWRIVFYTRYLACNRLMVTCHSLVYFYLFIFFIDFFFYYDQHVLLFYWH